VDAGFVKATAVRGNDTTEWIPESLTWQGHEFLNAARDNTIWKKALNKAGSMPISVLQEWLVQLARVATGL
jgi:hypothetical protein